MEERLFPIGRRIACKALTFGGQAVKIDPVSPIFVRARDLGTQNPWKSLGRGAQTAIRGNAASGRVSSTQVTT